MTGVGAAWGRLGIGKRIVVAIVAVFALVYALQLATEAVIGGGDPGGPTSSSYATGGDGYGAWADLLAERGHPVERLRTPLAKADLDPGSTVVVADPDVIEPADAESLVELVAKGGRLIVAGRGGTPLLGPFAGAPIAWRADGVETATPLVPTSETDGVQAVAGSGRGAFGPTGALLPALGGDRRVTVAVGRASAGAGVVAGVADARLLDNDHLARRDNAALALALVGPGRRPVVFAESVHGYGSSTGLSALPTTWKWAAGGLLLAVLCGLWAAGQRLGPPEQAHRDLPPPRRAYVDALAADLARADPSSQRCSGLARRRRTTRSPWRRTSAMNLAELRVQVNDEVGKVVVGQQTTVDLLLVAASVGGHALLQGVPGVAKTLLANAVARALGVEFRRAQFTPDMLPSDLTGTMTLRDRELVFRPGPVFANVLLADEINRTPPKTQAALLEAMQERQVTVDGVARPLPDPFLVVATQNPIEYEGTYPLPEAQLDRFLVRVDVGYPSEDDEVALLDLTHRGVDPSTLGDVAAVVDAAGLAAVRDEVDATTVSPEVARYVTALVRRTRDLPSVEVGASPRAGVHLLAASKASARLSGRSFVTPDDVVWMATPVLRHRLVLRPEAELERFRPDEAVAAAVASVPVPR